MENKYAVAMSIADKFAKDKLHVLWREQGVKNHDINRILEKSWSELKENASLELQKLHQEVFQSAYEVLFRPESAKALTEQTSIEEICTRLTPSTFLSDNLQSKSHLHEEVGSWEFFDQVFDRFVSINPHMVSKSGEELFIKQPLANAIYDEIRRIRISKNPDKELKDFLAGKLTVKPNLGPVYHPGRKIPKAPTLNQLDGDYS